MAICLVWVAVCLLVLPLVNGTYAASLVFIGVFAVTAFSMSAPQQHRLIGLNPSLAAVLVSLHSSILYLAIALAGALGGLGISVGGSGSLGFIAAALAVLALLLSELSHRLVLRRPTSAATTPATTTTADATD
ncbi:hypothetical protein [Streptomyces sp. NPDC014744]|uniref:hypothetical protein n=1 Tax=Streptomyces sp. NPDC014744 TaxID=3364903 RepID=UPI003700C4E7